nr:mitochondrial RNA helicase [Cryptococcus depauperatus CBS 7841]
MLARAVIKTSRKVCLHCALTHFPRSFATSILLARQSTSKDASFRSIQSSKPSRQRRIYQQRQNTPLTIDAFEAKVPPRPQHLTKSILRRLPLWIGSDRVMDKFEAYGLEPSLVKDLSKEWIKNVRDKLENVQDDVEAQAALQAEGWDPQELIIASAEDRFMSAIESLALRNFLCSIKHHARIPVSQQNYLSYILSVTDLSKLASSSDYLPARSLKRHFHLHIGPTNSGKTYNALKSLSQAKTGAYAGPLRLLAHEVWERMNLGSVGGLDGKGRKCNLLTGEERRVVDPDAGLLSCTVEMLPLAGLGSGGFDVVVIDEIQMLGDSQRGGSWTKAVLGVAAKEVHLCGDETTVELLRSMISSLGDQLTVHEYNRLTPLSVADSSLDNDYSKVEDGDCIVTFSRTNIFEVKKQVEGTTGKKCAVVYGALPPETRAEQARDFNDENGMCKVLVASDAVGMGLNLYVSYPASERTLILLARKIKRIIFESLSKYNGKSDVPLSLMQIKQIAGRAGRYKTSSDSSQNKTVSTPDETPAMGGQATTLQPTDLEMLRELMTRPLPLISRAKLEVPTSQLVQLAGLLPENTPYAELLQHFSSLAKPPAHTTLAGYDHKLPLADLVEPFRNRLSLGEVDLFCFAPVNSRDERAKNIFINLVEDYAELGCVEIENIFASSDLLTTLNQVHDTLCTLPPLPSAGQIAGKKQLIPPVIIQSLPSLETLHKTLVLYIWLSFRLEVAFPDRKQASELKVKCEKMLEECLERLPGLRMKKGNNAASKQAVKNTRRERANEQEHKRIDWVSGSEIKKEQQKKVWRELAILEQGQGSGKRLDVRDV